jgi:hypothetical protein
VIDHPAAEREHHAADDEQRRPDEPWKTTNAVTDSIRKSRTANPKTYVRLRDEPLDVGRVKP